MKKIYSLLTILLAAVFCFSCQSDETVSEEGYLRISAETVGVTNSSRVIEGYNPKQLAVEIVNAGGTTIESTNDFSEWKNSNKTFRLAPGTYTVKAASYGFDGSESGFDIPYYVGSTKVTVKTGETATAAITCTLANVKVTVEFDDTFKAAFKEANSVVKSAVESVASQKFVMGEAAKTAYFPVGNLTSTITVVNKLDKEYTRDDVVANVKARDWVKFIYKAKATGTGGVKVDIADNGHTYTFTFDVTMNGNETIDNLTMAMADANSFATCAYVNGSITAKEGVGTVNPAKMFIEYKKAADSEWTSVAAVINGADAYKATLTGLTAETSYQYRMAYRNGNTNFESEAKTFTTETQNKVPNLSFDNWVKDGKHYYANASMDAVFWDSGNVGANTLSEKNPTRPEESDVVKGKAARLGSITTAGQFAAGSLFTGAFGSATLTPLGARLNFGRPFTERPSQLTGYFKYTPGTITHTKKDFIKKGTDRDSCSIYILLADWSAPFAVNTGEDQFVNINDKSIIAYGELPKVKLSPANAMTQYEKFTIDLLYRDLTRKPTYILIVCSASKYGDYFTGSTSSVLLLDEFDLIYGEPKIDTAYIK